MQRQPNPGWFKILKKAAVIGFVAEAVAFAGTYAFWYRLNTNRDFRYYCHVNYPTILEGYYKVGEYFDDIHNVHRIRQTDLAVWAANPPKQS